VPGVEQLIAQRVADREKIGVWGHSYGGYCVLALVVQTQLFKAAVSDSGYSDMFSMYGELDEEGGSFGLSLAETGQLKMGKTPWEDRTRYIENSPFFFLDRGQDTDHACPRRERHSRASICSCRNFSSG